ncbi:DUF4367 domain-containing protein [[Ruminococcus] torques]|uniref:DUF4367 domain-containing protein n=1 Tax=[Ruminococcus] torques TaxID=33039 RepID=UPI00242F6121|nr:DUF4367 domain-containing protein [[Ruminococcus] torques]
MENAKELFIKAFMEAERLDNVNLPSEDNIQWDFSEKFKKSMEKLIRKNNRIQLSTRRTVAKSLLAAIIAILVLFTGLMSVAATREPIIEFVKKVFPQFNEITLSENSVPSVDTIKTVYTLTDLPEGFELETYQKDDYSVFSVWKNDTGEEIVFSQNILDTTFTVDNEHDYKEIYINGYKAYFIEDEVSIFLKWTDGHYWFTINAPISYKDSIVNITENILEKN